MGDSKNELLVSAGPGLTLCIADFASTLLVVETGISFGFFGNEGVCIGGTGGTVESAEFLFILVSVCRICLVSLVETESGFSI